MKIAMLVRGYIPVPRPVDMIYAPIDLEIAIARGLAERGHSVDIYAPLGSELDIPGVNVITLNLRPLVHNQEEFKSMLVNIEHMAHYVPGNWDRYMVNEMFRRAKRHHYDLLHFHHPEIALAAAQMNPRIPVVYTMHDPFYAWYRDMFDLYMTPNQHFVSISNNQRRDAPDINYAATVYNGTDVKQFSFSDEPEDYLLFVGRIAREKGIKEAVQVAKETKHRLLIIGSAFGPGQEYFDQYIKPELDDQILYLGYIEQAQLPRYYQKAKAVLTPVQWEEPFGLTTVEAMACGTPVISLRRGAAPEIIEDGVTGYVVDSIADMCTAVKKVHKLDRRACRDHVKTKFSVNQMVDGYEKVYRDVLRNRHKINRGYVRSKIQEVPGKLKRQFLDEQLGLDK